MGGGCTDDHSGSRTNIGASEVESESDIQIVSFVTFLTQI